MGEIPTLYVRNVPPQVHADLQRLAREHGRSLNAEALDILERAATHSRAAERLFEIARKINLPPDAPSPKEMIQQGRDERGY